METISSFADWMRQRRKALDLTQTALAERVNCAVVTIKKIEQETRRPSREVARLLAEHLAIPAAERDAFLRLARGEYVETTGSAANIGAAPAFLQAIGKEISASAFVAREQELAHLETHLIAALNGSGRIVFITGEAGRGKTTLMAEFARRAQERTSDLVVASGNCDAYAGVGDPYLPFRDVMALLAGDVEAKWKAGVLSQEQARRLWALLPRTVQEIGDHGLDLLDVFAPGAALVQRARAHPAQEANAWVRLQAHLEQQRRQPAAPQQRQLFEQYTQVLCALAAHHPLLLVLDDLQWIDNASAGLLFHLGRRLSNSRILILGAYRASEVPLGPPEEGKLGNAHPVAPIVQELKRRYGDIEINLSELAAEIGRAFVDALVSREPNQLDVAFRSALFERTRGHPLFTVELLRDLQERQELVQDEAGCWVEGGRVDWQALPSRVEAVIARRMDRLPRPLWEALKVASVEGETFSAEVAARVLGVDEQQMVQQLSSVAGRQHHLVRSQGSERLGQQALSRYRFGHILFQNYLYETLDAAERIYLHAAVGRALEDLYREETADVAVQLAHHFQTAGLVIRAVGYLFQAGERAARLSAHKEAVGHLSNGLSLLGGLPDAAERAQQELRLQIALGISLAAVKGWSAPEAGHAYERARVLAQQLGETSQFDSILWGLYVFYTVQGQLRTAYKLGKQCLHLAQDQSDAPLLVVGHFMVGTPSFHLGQLNAAQAHLQQGRIAYLAETHHTFVSRYGPDFGVFAASYESHALWYLGYPDQALQRSQDALALAQELGHPYSLALAQSYAAMLHQFRREELATQVWAEAALALCAEHELPYYGAWAALMRGWTVAEQGEIEAGTAQMQQALADLRAMETGLRESYYLGLLTEVHARDGRVEEGMRLLEEALALLHKSEERCHEAELYRLQGELLTLRGEASHNVEESFLHAVDIARRQNAKSLELRAVMSLSRLWQRQGKDRAAHQQLATIYDWFGEGFDTPDLREAKALLDVLSW